ncbi:oligopeptide transport ATP-binding protein OppD [Marinomonas sp. MED121]|uniref:ABC transporter ATP-binding protein n=1 Tax=Marinomonas sp. MED121 TaxID=314277 RepID=UPI00006900CC|nr:ABC transporter ATP-binding protein [Marinomonas sp. MED121]EAQ65782.1 oligopeptide transport ATP-binding protein OppD [Marinomonas sp. MED121]
MSHRHEQKLLDASLDTKMIQAEHILRVEKLAVSFETDSGPVAVLDDVSFSVKKGQTLGLVGESGCGKSVTAASIMGLLPQPYGKVVGGDILYQGNSITALSLPERYALRGNRISMIFQEPMTALNPVHTIGRQLSEVYELHKPELNKKARKASAIAMLNKVGIAEPEIRFDLYPHQLSGGMRQRVMIAMALACEPDILIADEPTTALDVTIQAQILELMGDLQAETGMAIIFITHDLGVVAEMCDQVVVMYAGNVVEHTDAFTLFESPSHPYTQGLMQSMPRLDAPSKTQLKAIPGNVPSLSLMPKGCRFSNRCEFSTSQCEASKPELEAYHNPNLGSHSETHLVRCFHLEDVNNA